MIARIDVTVAGSGTRRVIRIVCHFVASDTRNRWNLPLARCPLALTSLDAIGVGAQLVRKLRSRTPLGVVVTASTPMAWANSSVALTFAWPSGVGASPEIVVLPDHLVGSPDVHDASGIALQPRISVGVEDTSSSLLLGGIGIIGRIGAAEPEVDLIQALLVSGAGVAPEAEYVAGKTAIVSKALSETMNSVVIESLGSATKQCLHDLSSAFGVRPSTRPVLASSEQTRDIRIAGRGALIDGRMVATDSNHAIDLDRAAIYLGSIWWGGGCRIVGPYAAELTRALIFGAALHAICESDASVDIERVLRDVERRSLTDRINERITGIFGRLRRTATNAIAVSIVRQMATASGDLIAEMTKERWGTVATSQHIATELRRRGVSLKHFPRAFQRRARRR